jgi:large conductance mechanosensitive channel
MQGGRKTLESGDHMAETARPKNKGVFNEFREFAMRGNVLDLAVGIIIGAAFNAVVNSLVNNVIMPPVGVVIGRMDFSDLRIPLPGNASIGIGLFVNDIVNFVIVAFAVFIIVRQANRLKSKVDTPTGEPTTKECPYCLTTVPIKATRCAACTSDLTQTTGAPLLHE